MPKSNNRNSGSALVIAIVAMMLLMVMSLVLLLASYSLYSNTVKTSNTAQCNELAQTMSLAIERELTVPDCTAAEEEKTLIESGDYPMWTYLRCNLMGNEWPAGTEKSMPLESETLTEAGAVVTAEISWEEVQESGSDTTTLVTILVTCKKGGQASTVKSIYALTITPLDGSFPSAVLSADYNPDGNTIAPEHWSFRLMERG